MIDEHLEAQYELQTHVEDEMEEGLEWEREPIDDVEWNTGHPGDGSGEDDLADLMAYGDEGCYDCQED